ncbi:MAG: hypothetical protein WEA59_08130 [Ferruginibacter sp.]
MSLDNIQLSTFLLKDLYKKTLVQLEALQPTTPQKEQSSISFLGKNERKILIVVDEENTTYLSDEDLGLLLSILSACKLTMADVALVNAHKNNNITYNALMEVFTPTLVLLFGIQPVQLDFPLQFPNYQLQRYNNQTYISSPSIKVLTAKKEMKKQLWISLQQYFFN